MDNYANSSVKKWASHRICWNMWQVASPNDCWMNFLKLKDSTFTSPNVIRPWEQTVRELELNWNGNDKPVKLISRNR